MQLGEALGCGSLSTHQSVLSRQKKKTHTSKPRMIASTRWVVDGSRAVLGRRSSQGKKEEKGKGGNALAPTVEMNQGPLIYVIHFDDSRRIPMYAYVHVCCEVSVFVPQLLSSCSSPHISPSYTNTHSHKQTHTHAHTIAPVGQIVLCINTVASFEFDAIDSLCFCLSLSCSTTSTAAVVAVAAFHPSPPSSVSQAANERTRR